MTHPSPTFAAITLPLMTFLTGPKADGVSPDGKPVVDDTVGRTVDDLVSQCRDELDGIHSSSGMESALVSGYVYRAFDGGVVLSAPDGSIAGLYADEEVGLSDVALGTAHRGQGLGAELVLQYAVRYGRLPTWDLEEPIYTNAGLAAHRAAWILHRRRPKVAASIVSTYAPPACPTP